MVINLLTLSVYKYIKDSTFALYYLVVPNFNVHLMILQNLKDPPTKLNCPANALETIDELIHDLV